MARDLTMEMEITPTLNVQATRNLINTLEKELRSVRSGSHIPLARKASALMQSLMSSGVATTPTQARMILADMMGGGFSAQQKAVMRSAQNITSAQLYLQRASQLEQKRFGTLSARTAYLSNQYQAFQQNPTAELATGLLGGLTSIRRELLKLYQEYRVNRRQVPPILRQIAQNTSSMKREVSDWDSQQPKGENSNNNLLVLAKKLTGIATVASGMAILFKKGTQAIASALQRGAQAMRLQAAYGKDVNWGDIRARAGIFNMSEEVAASTSEYASDFRQRMLWGEVSEREIIGLSRAGRWGRMVMSGEARRNPAAANQAFEELVATTDRAKMRSILRQLGLPQDLMQYNIQGYDKGTRAELDKKFEDLAEKEWQAAVLMYDAGNQYQIATQQLSDLLAKLTAEGVQYISPQGRAFARNMGVEVVTEPEISQLKRRTRDSFGRAVLPTYDVLKPMVETLVSRTPHNINQTVNNNIVIQGNADANTVDALRDEMSRPQAISSWFEQAQLMGGSTTY